MKKESFPFETERSCSHSPDRSLRMQTVRAKERKEQNLTPGSDLRNSKTALKLSPECCWRLLNFLEAISSRTRGRRSSLTNWRLDSVTIQSRSYSVDISVLKFGWKDGQNILTGSMQANEKILFRSDLDV